MNIRKTRHVYFELTDRSGWTRVGKEDRNERKRGIWIRGERNEEE